jgi:hypothetical protein
MTTEATNIIADKLGNKALEYLASFEELTKQYAPDALEAALTVVMLGGVQNVVFGVMGLAALASGAWLIHKGYTRGIQHHNFDAGAGFFAPGGALVVLGVVTILASGLLSLWTYVAIFEPKLYIAYKLFGRLL